MGLSAEDLERILKLFALVQQGVVELESMIQLIHQQSGQTTEQILADAEVKNAEAKAIIDSL